MNESKDIIREGERRQATILFADLSGFTGMSEKMDPEDLTFLINECLKIMGACIKEHEGTIDKFMGDCVMALFGVPATIENAPQKAINAAIEIRNRINQFSQNSKVPYPLDIHIGINTGMVIAGPVGSDEKKEFTVMGDAVNVASRLKDISSAGQIFVGPDTYRYTKENFEFRILERVSIKGKDDQVEVYELLSIREKTDRKGWRSSRMVSSVLVGRNRELDQLSLQLLKVINGEGSIVNVVGEAGIGKSRLMAELRTKEETGRITLLEGRAVSSGKNLSFHPIIDLLKKWSGIKEEDTDKIISSKLEKKIHVFAKEESGEIFPFIAILMGLKLSGKYADRTRGIEGTALEKLILKSLNTFLSRMASVQPVMIVLEDLHWADLTSIEFLESLYRLSFENPILFVNVFRPGYRETGERILQTIGERYSFMSINIQLKPLNGGDCESLIHNLLRIKGFPLDVKDQIVQRTGGNPFFIEEIIRSFIDEGIIVIRNDRFEVTRKIESVVIPGTINEVIMARIDRLDEESRSLLKIASVIGRSFYYKILTHMTEIEEAVDQRLAQMEEIQLISKQHKKEEVAYLFKHALAQEATYESILLKKRKELHLKTARTIEKIFSDKLSEFYGILAWHYSKGEDYIKSEEYLLKAGEEALRTSASAEAIHFYREGLKLYRSRHGEEADQEKIALMEKNIGIALLNKGQAVAAIPYFDYVLNYYRVKTKANKLETGLMVLSGIFHLVIALYLPTLKWRKSLSPTDQEIIDLLNSLMECNALSEATRLPYISFLYMKWVTGRNLSKFNHGTFHLMASTLMFSYGGISFPLHRKALEFAKERVKQGDVFEKLNYAISRTLNNRMEGNYTIHAYDPDLVEESLKMGELKATSYYLIFSFFIELGQGRFQEVKLKIAKLQEMGKIFDNNIINLWVFIATAKLMTKSRKLQEALSAIDQSIELSKKVDDRAHLHWAYESKAYIQFLMEDIPGAEQSMEQGSQFSPGGTLYVMKTTQVLSHFLIQLHHLENVLLNGGKANLKPIRKETMKVAREAVRVAGKIADDRVEILKCTGTYYWITGNRGKALNWWKKGIAEGERLGALPELARIYWEVGRRLREDKSKIHELNGLSANQCLDKAADLFRELDLQWDLDEMEKFKMVQTS